MSILQALQRDEVAKRFECLLLAPAVMGSTFSVRASEISGPGIDKAWPVLSGALTICLSLAYFVPQMKLIGQ